MLTETTITTYPKTEITDLAFLDSDPGWVFAAGVAFDDKGGVNFQLSGQTVLWVAVKGGNNDWAIYFGYLHDSFEFIKKYGYKVSVENVRNLAEVSDEVLKRYRK